MVLLLDYLHSKLDGHPPPNTPSPQKKMCSGELIDDLYVPTLFLLECVASLLYKFDACSAKSKGGGGVVEVGSI